MRISSADQLSSDFEDFHTLFLQPGRTAHNAIRQDLWRKAKMCNMMAGLKTVRVPVRDVKFAEIRRSICYFTL